MRAKKRYVILVVESDFFKDSDPGEKLHEWIKELYGIYGVSKIHLREVFRIRKNVYIFSISASAKDFFRSIFILDGCHIFKVIKVTGSLRKAIRIARSIPKPGLLNDSKERN
ncbi:MAG: hypothetical protein LM590_02265 [Thermofilum sp.]|nr:hypothetical protein [Thermofilum sp.]